MSLSLFPTRAAIGRGTLLDGSVVDILMTAEFARALADLFTRVGGTEALSNTEITALVRDLAVLEAFSDTPQPPDTQLDQFFGSVDPSSAIAEIRNGLEDVQRMIATAPDGAGQLVQALKDLSRRSYALAQAAVPVSVTGTLAATVLATIPVPANVLGKNGSLRITTIWSVTNSANNKTIKVRFGGTDISSTLVTTVSTYQEQRTIQNRNAPNSQVFIFGGFGYSGAPIGTMAKDTTIVQNIDIVAQLANVGETITLEAYTVELIPSPN